MKKYLLFIISRVPKEDGNELKGDLYSTRF